MILAFRASIPALAIAILLAGSAMADTVVEVKVVGTGKELGESPVVVEVTRPITPGAHYVLHPREEGPDLPANVYKDQGKVYLGAVLDRVPATGSRTFELQEVRTESTRSGVTLVESGAGRRIDVAIDGRPLTSYVPDDGPKPYYFPLLGPSGALMTRSFPMKTVEGDKVDHPHHRSLWFTHGSVNKVDFWSELPHHGTIRETSRPTVVGGSAVGVLRTTDDWTGPDGKKVCEDERVTRIYHTRKSRILDFDITLKATTGPVVLGDTKEGMFGLRIASSMDVTTKKGGRIVNAEGIANQAAWGQASPWVDYSGPVGGQTVGITILNHPESFRYPTTWHVRDYGLFAANPFGWRDFGQKTSGEYLLPAGQSIRFGYRLILHEGEAPIASIASAFSGYEAPPKLTISE